MKIFYFIFVLIFVIQTPFLLSDSKQKVILDFDLGSDIDDAFALALVLASPELELVGITLDYGMTSERAKIACRLLYETGKEHIPVAVGRQTNQPNGQQPRYRSQFYWAKNFDKVKPIEQPADDFIIKMLNTYPNEIILFTTGPVPNMADIIEKDPNALGLAKHIYSMFGSFYLGYNSNPIPSAEWNVRADVTASKKFAACAANITYAGLDITTFVKLEKEMRLKLLMRQSPLTDALCSLYSLWGKETPVLYDVVAIGMLLWPDLFDTRPAHVRVIDGGYTVVDESKNPNANIGVLIRKNEFLKRIMDRYLQQNLNRVF